MIHKMMRSFSVLFCMLAAVTVMVRAEEAVCDGIITDTSGISAPKNLTDGSRRTYSSATQEASVTVSRDGGIGALYIEFDRVPQEWALTDPASGKRVLCGQNGFLHEFVDVTALFGGMPERLVIEAAEGTVFADIYVFSAGDLPDWVQQWQPPCEEADLLLVSSHSDDEQLFFAGVLPYYAVERELQVQVAYVVQHFHVGDQWDHRRPHEQLDGLWAVGIRNYPVMSDFPDLYSESKDRETAFKSAVSVYERAGFSYEDFVSYFTECIRRFKPLVVVSHDPDGEYGHGTHVLTSAALTDAVSRAANADEFPGSAAEYGAWAVEKTYLHLYEENRIVMDFDTPLERFGGKTAFEVTREGFDCHESQHWTWFYRWIYGTEANPIRKASDIRSYSPCLYGLYQTSVGPDEVGGDFFENVETYAQRAAAEEEAARKAAEEAARQEEARLKAEEEARLQAEEAARLEAEEKAREQGLLLIGLAGAVLGAVISFGYFRRRKHKGKKMGGKRL